MKKRWRKGKITDFIYHKFWKKKGSAYDRKLKEKIRLIHPVNENELMNMVEQYRKEQILLLVQGFFTLVFLCILFAFLLFLPKQPVKIERNSYGEGEKNESVYTNQKDPIDFTVQEREYSKSELNEVFQDNFMWVKQRMLKENSAASEVRSDLNFLTEVPGGFKAEWISENPDVIREDGSVENEDWEKDQSELVAVQLLLSYRDEIRGQKLYFHVRGPILTAEEKLRKKIRNVIQTEEEKTRTKESFSLPLSVEGIELSQNSPVRQMGGIVVIVVMILVLSFYQKQNRLKEKLKQRKTQILEDYPRLVSQLVLYLGAGMNLKSAFEKLAEEYKDNRKEGRVKFRYAYEELCVLSNEMRTGMPEKRAYELYGERIGEGCYTKLMALLIQNLQKGNVGLLRALSEEEEAAFQKRISQAGKLGEETGTKLLFPMVVLLIIVMVIVMFPAVLQFQGY